MFWNGVRTGMVVIVGPLKRILRAHRLVLNAFFVAALGTTTAASVALQLATTATQTS